MLLRHRASNAVAAVLSAATRPSGHICLKTVDECSMLRKIFSWNTEPTQYACG